MTSPRAKSVDPIWERINGWDKLFAHRTRLAICVLLTRQDTLTFSLFKALGLWEHT